MIRRNALMIGCLLAGIAVVEGRAQTNAEDGMARIEGAQSFYRSENLISHRGTETQRAIMKAGQKSF